MSKIQYYTLEGNLISFEVDRYITLSSINELTLLYVASTNRFPTQVFVRYDLYSILIHDISKTGTVPTTYSLSKMGFRSSVGNLEVIPVQNAYLPLLVGNYFEYDNNDVNKVFEEVVLNV